MARHEAVSSFEGMSGHTAAVAAAASGRRAREDGRTTTMVARSGRAPPAGRTSRISVLLADDHDVLRTGLRVLLEAQRDMVVVCDAADGRTAVQMTKTLRPDVVVMDIGMPLLNGFEATRQIREEAPATRVIVLSASEDERFVRRVIAMGAAGYVNKRNSFTTLAAAIRATSDGLPFIDPLVALAPDGPAGAGGARRGTLSAEPPRLTSRETEVLQLIAESRCNKECAAELGIAVKTVEKHRHNLMAKLDIHDVAGLTRYAIAMRVIEAPERALEPRK